MIRKIAIAGLGSVLLLALPAYAQEVPELDGAPGPLKIPPAQTAKPPVAPKIVTPAPKTPQKEADGVKAAEAQLAQRAAAQKAEQVRLERQAAELKARQASLDARAAELAAEEKRLGQLRTEQQAELATQQAQLARDRAEAERQTQLAAREPDEVPAYDADSRRPADATASRRFRNAGLDRDLARRSCVRAGEDAARDRNFYSARYDTPPVFYQGRTWELRGLMRLEDRRGYVVVDTVCEVDADGEALHFSFLR